MHHRGEVDRIGLQGLTPGKGEQPLDQRARPLRRLDRTVDQAKVAPIPLRLAAEQVEPAENGGQQVVEVVRDAAGQLAHRLHLLALAQRLLGLAQRFVLALPLGHVAARGIDEIAVDRGQPGEPADRTIGGDEAVLEHRYLARPARDRRFRQRGVVGMQEVEIASAHHLLGPMAEDRGPGRIDRAEHTLEIEDDEQVARHRPDAIELGGPLGDAALQRPVGGSDRGQQPGILDRDRGLGGKTNDQRLVPRGKDAGPRMPEQEAAQYPALPRHDRDREVAGDIGMARRHPLERRVAAIARIAGDIVGPDDDVAEDRPQYVGRARTAEADEILALVPGQREQVQPLAAFVHDVVEIGADRRAGQLDARIGHHLNQPLDIMLGGERGVDAVERLDRALGAAFLAHIFGRDADRDHRARGIADRHPVLAPDTRPLGTAARGTNEFDPAHLLAGEQPCEGGARLIGDVGCDLLDRARQMRGARQAVHCRQPIIDPQIAQVEVEHRQRDRRGFVHRGKLFGDLFHRQAALAQLTCRNLQRIEPPVRPLYAIARQRLRFRRRLTRSKGAGRKKGSRVGYPRAPEHPDGPGDQNGTSSSRSSGKPPVLPPRPPPPPPWPPE